MAGLVPAIHVLLSAQRKAWMPGTRPGMTQRKHSAMTTVAVAENNMPRIAVCCLFAAAALSADPAAADPVADFYRGRNINLYIGYSVGGGYDNYARVLARHLGNHIPGNPSILPQNMPGAGSLRAVNFLYNAAPKDGTAIATFGRGLAMEPLIGSSQTSFDARKFLWLGSGSDEVSLCGTWHTSRIKTWNDMQTIPFTVGGEGSGSDPDIFAAMMKNVFGVKLRIVSGYPGSAEVALAVERKEVDGRCGWSLSSMRQMRPDWLPTKQFTAIVQLNLEKSPDLPDVPVVTDYAQTQTQRQILKLVLSRQNMARPFAAPPGVPADRAAALRKAFDQTMADREFIDEARARGLEINPVTGAEIDRLLAEVYQTPPDVVAKAKAAVAPEQ
jgi:tripartite-type tricarboxylate transporter receptor subunit TctC